MHTAIETLSYGATQVRTLCSDAASTAGKLGSYVLSPLDNAGNDPSAAWYGLKFLIGINELVSPGACLTARVAAGELADVIDYLSMLHLIKGVVNTNPQDYVSADTAVESWKNLAFGIVGVSVSILLANSLGIVDLGKATTALSQFKIFEITPFAALAEFGLGHVFQVSLIAGYTFALYEQIRDAKQQGLTAARVTAILHYSSSIAARVAMLAGGVFFPVSATALGVLITVSAGSGLLKCHLNGYK